MGMDLNVKIFTEGGGKVGLGHISRCTALYDEAERQGIPVKLFILNTGFEDNKNNILKSRKCSFVNWQDSEYLLSNVKKNDLCIVDSYLAPIEIYELIARQARKALYIDDYGRLVYPQGIVVNPSLSAEGIEYMQKQNVEYLLGEQYIILRTPFLEKKKKKFNKRVEQVLITMGGADPLNLTASITNLLSKKYPELVFNVVLGKRSQFTKQLEQHKNVRTYFNLTAQEMCDLMLQTDFAISAAGQTIHELIYLQIPFIAIQTADNQKNNVNELKRIILKSWIIEKNEKDILKKINKNFQELLKSEEPIKLPESIKRSIDGLGCERILKRLINMRREIFLKEVNANDCNLLFRWINEKTVRENAFNTEMILYDEHVKWLHKKIHDENTKIYIAYDGEEPIGQIRVEADDLGEGLISFSIDSNYRGKGYGTTMLLKLVNLMNKREQQDLKRLIGKVKFENMPSRKAFLKANFHEQKMENYFIYTYELVD